jgi:N-hydroxyarylamine O-acetyltransferase
VLVSEEVRLNAYFERIGFAGSIAPTFETLDMLHALQPAAIPFENLDLLLGRPVLLDQPSLNQKLIGAARGGSCFELNLLFLRVLQELGFAARAHLATTLMGRAAADPAPAPDHLFLTVDIGGTTFHADVGLGGLMQFAPLKLRGGLEQHTPLETYRITGEDPALRLEYLRKQDGEPSWRPLYQFSLAEADDAVFKATSDRLGADPQGFLRRHLLVERSSTSGRRLLRDSRLTRPDGSIETLADVAALRDCLAGDFGIDPVPLDGLDAALAPIAAHPPERG